MVGSKCPSSPNPISSLSVPLLGKQPTRIDGRGKKVERGEKKKKKSCLWVGEAYFALGECVCVCVYIYIYIYTHTHTHKHSYTCSNIIAYILTIKKCLQSECRFYTSGNLMVIL